MCIGKDGLKKLLVIAQGALCFFESDISTTYECFGVKFSSASLCIDDCVHEWLCEAWFVCFVVAASSVAHHVNDNVFTELLAILESQVSYAYTGFWIITIHMEDRSLHHACYIGAVNR